MFPLLLQGVSRDRSEQRARETLVLLGLGDRGDHFAHQLSGGEQQRVAIARAIVRDKHGGDLTFETKLGAGTTFLIQLPLAGKPRTE